MLQALAHGDHLIPEERLRLCIVSRAVRRELRRYPGVRAAASRLRRVRVAFPWVRGGGLRRFMHIHAHRFVEVHKSLARIAKMYTKRTPREWRKVARASRARVLGERGLPVTWPAVWKLRRSATLRRELRLRVIGAPMFRPVRIGRGTQQPMHVDQLEKTILMSPFPSSMRVPRTPLVGACESTTDESAYDCFALIRAGADVNSGGERNRWPLTWAAEDRREGQFHACGRDLDKVKMLVAAGARINRVGGDHGGTALHMAARDDRPEIVQFLIDAGIDVDSLDRDEKTAYDRAREAGAERAAGAIASFDFGRAIQMAIAEARYDRGAGPRPPEGPSFDFRIE